MSPESASDAALIAAVRRGDTTAYGVLYQRHLPAANRMAGCLTRTRAEREDLVAEAYTRVLQALRSGRGPTEEFRPYLLVTMRHLAINSGRRNLATALFADLPEAILSEMPAEPAGDESHAKAAHAFAGLPERWRMVLWHTEIEGESPTEIAPLLGMTPNGVAALAYRAREGLRQAYLRQHVPAGSHLRECRVARDKLAGWVRRSISAPQQRKIDAHLNRCGRCRDLADGLARVNGDLPAILAAIVLGAPLVSGYLKPVVWTGVAAASWLTGVKALLSTGAAQAGAAAAVAAVTAVTVTASGPGEAVPALPGGDRAISGPQAPGPGAGRRPGAVPVPDRNGDESGAVNAPQPADPQDESETPAENSAENSQGSPNPTPGKPPKNPGKPAGNGNPNDQGEQNQQGRSRGENGQ
ncbi:MAG TPA: sigma-70 family RNA polymerase sigma factor [Actinophytocola sp.]|uniref:sigma-70 family RNA polymerase sigma factor n=1 Tax=Actinophytocola sp. TaxID=1872138 RepID=UPI002DBBF909|nr:sigma-70 family RNA polymerase sigma factor [Actinophytocola sp.]HEU5470522.1 sigma-70 family RNA polymerase sigma factor [Actinophytocola sp.]